MSNIHDLSQERVAREPHSTGPARCLDCGYEWVAVSPTGTVWLEFGGGGHMNAAGFTATLEQLQRWLNPV